jgi:hypothetical protein
MTVSSITRTRLKEFTLRENDIVIGTEGVGRWDDAQWLQEK